MSNDAEIKALEEKIAATKAELKQRKKSGKWADVVKTLPRLEAPRSERVEEIRNSYFGSTPAKLAEAYAVLRSAKEKVHEEEKKINEQLEAITSLLIEAYEAEGISTVKLAETGETISHQQEPIASVTDKDANRKWAIKNGYGNLMGLHPATVNSLTKELLINGEPPPDGVTVFTLDKLVLRRK